MNKIALLIALTAPAAVVLAQPPALRQEIDTLDGPKQRGARNSRIDAYNYERSDVANARAAAQTLMADYEKFRARFPAQVKGTPPRFTLSELPEVFR